MDYIVFVLLLIFPAILYLIRNTKFENKFLCLIVVILSLICGLRNYDSGIDTQTYVNLLRLISEGKSEYAYGLEDSFKTIVKLIMYIYDSPTCVFIICSFITNAFVFASFYKYKKYASLSIMVLFYICAFYMHTFNIMRQMCSVAIIFFSVNYLIENKIIRYLLGLGVASLFHLSSIISVLLISLFFKKNRLNFLILFTFVVSIIAYIYSDKIIYEYSHYFNSIQSSIGIGLIAKIVIFLLSFMITIRKIKLRKISKLYIQVSIIYFVGILISFVGYFYPNMQRIGFYFLIFETVFYGITIKNINSTSVYDVAFVIFVILMQIFVYGRSIVTNSMGIFPYSVCV